MKKLLSASLAGMMLVSCVPITPQTRIAQNPNLFSALSPKQKELVERGEVARGMSRDAVFLAWGPPSRTFQGSKNGRMTDRWDYAAAQPVYHNSFYGDFGYGYGHGPYGHHSYSAYGFGMSPEVAYVPYRVASVWFINGLVDSWERAR